MYTDHSDRKHKTLTWLSGMSWALLGSILLATLSTLGDWLWNYLGLTHRVVWGILHGGIIFLALGAYLGALAPGRKRTGAGGGLLVGFTGALFFYLLAPWLRMTAMFPAWLLVWLLLALLWNRLQRSRPSLRTDLLRGVLAAVFSGLAFYAISGIWFSHRPEPDYPLNFASWTIAFLPGFLALLWKR